MKRIASFVGTPETIGMGIADEGRGVGFGSNIQTRSSMDLVRQRHTLVAVNVQHVTLSRNQECQEEQEPTREPHGFGKCEPRARNIQILKRLNRSLNY